MASINNNIIFIKKCSLIQKHLLMDICIGIYIKHIKEEIKIIVSKTKINLPSGLTL